MPLVKDVPIIDLLYARVRTAYRCIDSARTNETRELWKHRKECYLQAMRYVKIAEGVDDIRENAVIMDFNEEDLRCLKD
jgi:hypothetical protein